MSTLIKKKYQIQNLSNIKNVLKHSQWVFFLSFNKVLKDLLKCLKILTLDIY